MKINQDVRKLKETFLKVKLMANNVVSAVIKEKEKHYFLNSVNVYFGYVRIEAWLKLSTLSGNYFVPLKLPFLFFFI